MNPISIINAIKIIPFGYVKQGHFRRQSDQLSGESYQGLLYSQGTGSKLK
jgi:hypothetical protein